MNFRTVKVGCVWAAGAFCVAAALMWQPGVDAVDGQPALTAEVARPKLVVDGVEVVAGRTAGASLDMAMVGDVGGFELTVTNTTGRTVELPLAATIRVAPPSSRMMRMVPMPRVIQNWQQTISIGPNESRTIALASELKLPAGMVSIILTSGKTSVPAMELPVNSPKRAGSATQPAELQLDQVNLQGQQ